MGVTAQGFWYPDPTTPASLQGMMSAAATASENVLKAANVKNGVPRAASEAALTAVYTNTIDPATGLAMAPVAGSQGSINGIPVIYDGARWWGPAYSRAEIRKTANFAVAVNTWTAYNAFGTTLTSSSGSGFTLQNNGIKVAAAGVYGVKGVIQFAANATGVRYFTISTVAGFNAGLYRVNNTATTTDTGLSTACDLNCNANDVIALYGYTTVGPLNIQQATMWVQRIG